MKHNQVVLNCLSILMVLLVGMAYAIDASADEKSTSTQQALQQLKLLQKRMSPGPESVNNKLALMPVPAKPESPPMVLTPVSNAVPTQSEKDTIDSLAFDEVTDQLFPLTPEQIVRIKKQ